MTTDVRASESTQGSSRSRALTWWLAGATFLGFVIRFAYVLGPARRRPLSGDPAYYRTLAGNIADGHWFREQAGWTLVPRIVETATHPPLFSLVLSVPSRLGFDTILQTRLFTCLVGVTVVPLIGLIANRLAGVRAAAIAAMFAATYPAPWVNDVNVWSEALLAPLFALLVLVSLRVDGRPTVRTAGIIGALVGLLTLTRAECILFLPLLAVPALWRGRDDRNLRLRRIAVATLAMIAVLLPWTIYNLTRFDEPVVISNNLGATMVASNNDAAWYGPATGWWTFGIPDPPGVSPGGDESVHSRELRDAGLHYVRTHERHLPRVVLARLGRMWDVYHPLQTAELDAGEGRGLWPARLGLAMYAFFVAFACRGVWLLRRRHVPLSWFWAPIAVASVTAIIFYGSPRFRVPADVALTIAAAVGVGIPWRRERETSSG